MENYTIIFLYGVVVIIISLMLMLKNFDSKYLLINIIGVSLLITSYVLKKNKEKYHILGTPDKDYDKAYLTGYTPGGAVYVDNPDDYPGLGWVN